MGGRVGRVAARSAASRSSPAERRRLCSVRQSGAATHLAAPAHILNRRRGYRLDVPTPETPSAPLRVLVSADLHIGRSSSPLPGGLAASVGRSQRAWETLVSIAEAQAIDLLIIAGDLIDADNARWEALGPVLAGIDRLRAVGTQTLAVAGNHDWASLPALERLLHQRGVGPRTFRLLGASGTWERVVIERSGHRLEVDGWSFPAGRWPEDPLASRPVGPPPTAPRLGIVHGELDGTGGAYAPIRRRSLEDADADGWIIGHVHRPSLEGNRRGFVLIPGSPQALDFGEQGAHGVWLLEVHGGRLGEPRMLPTSTIRYESITVDLSKATDLAGAERACLAALEEVQRRCRDESGPQLDGLGLRMALVGRTPVHAQEEALRRQLAQWQGSGDLALVVDAVEARLLPPIDLESLAGGAASSPLTMTARLLRALEATSSHDSTTAAATDPELRSLLESVRRRLAEVDLQPEYASLRASADLADAAADRAGSLRVSQPGDGSNASSSLDAALRQVLASLLLQEST